MFLPIGNGGAHGESLLGVLKVVSKYYYMTVEDCNIIGGSQLCWYLPNVAHRTSTIIVWWYFFYLEREGSLCIDTTFLQLRNNRAQKNNSINTQALQTSPNDI